jgi:hypothetical protein
MKFGCRIGYHRWEKWGEVYQQGIVTRHTDPITWAPMPEFDRTWYEDRQRRSCQDCGRTQRRRVR